MFALGRLPGWISQWKELREDPAMRIGRPRQIYQGETIRPFVPLAEREAKPAVETLEPVTV
jgi:citrate synthase